MADNGNYEQDHRHILALLDRTKDTKVLDEAIARLKASTRVVAADQATVCAGVTPSADAGDRALALAVLESLKAAGDALKHADGALAIQDVIQKHIVATTPKHTWSTGMCTKCHESVNRALESAWLTRRFGDSLPDEPAERLARLANTDAPPPSWIDAALAAVALLLAVGPVMVSIAPPAANVTSAMGFAFLGPIVALAVLATLRTGGK